MSDKLLVHLNSDRIQMEPGGTPVDLVVTIQNLGDAVDQYTVELTGLDPEWFTAPVTSVGLFPQDREQVRISLHPPKRPGLRAGAYPLRVLVRSRGGAQQETAEGTLEVRGFAVYRMDITPRRQTARGSGKFVVQLANTGNADVRLSLTGRDAEDACRLQFPKDDSPLVRAVSKTQVALVVQPHKRPWIGAEHAYDFTVTARPQDAGGEPQTVPGQFTYRPMFTSWAPLRRLFVYTALLVVGLVVVLLVVDSPGTRGDVLRRFEVAGFVIGGWTCGQPLVGRFCPSTRPPEANLACSFQNGFRDYAAAEPKLIGDCVSNEAGDRFGNTLQYSTTGVLFWQKESDTMYFFRSNSAWAYIHGRSEILYGPGTF